MAGVSPRVLARVCVLLSSYHKDAGPVESGLLWRPRLPSLTPLEVRLQTQSHSEVWRFSGCVGDRGTAQAELGLHCCLCFICKLAEVDVGCHPLFLVPQVFYLVSVSLCVTIIVAFQLTAFTFRENLAATALLLVLFGYVMRNTAAELRFVFRKRTPPRDGFEPAAGCMIFSLCKQLCCLCESRAAESAPPRRVGGGVGTEVVRAGASRNQPLPTPLHPGRG